MSTTAEQERTALAVRGDDAVASQGANVFASRGGFNEAVPMAKTLATSSLVPGEYRNNPANCLIAMELAFRTRASVLQVMQHLHVIQGRPSWSAAFLIACVNSSGRFTPIRYDFQGEGEKTACRAYATEKATGEVLYGTWITWAMVKAEGWNKKQGSKWLSMPDQMFCYRAAAFWVRAYAPEISLGMHVSDEVEDYAAPRGPTTGAQELNAAIRAHQGPSALPTSAATEDEPVKCADCGGVGSHTFDCKHFADE